MIPVKGLDRLSGRPAREKQGKIMSEIQGSRRENYSAMDGSEKYTKQWRANMTQTSWSSLIPKKPQVVK